MKHARTLVATLLLAPLVAIQAADATSAFHGAEGGVPRTAEDRWIGARSTGSQTFKARQTRTLDAFPSLAKVPPVELTRYGGLAAERQKATGHFRVEKLGDRWWMIDPEGGRFVFKGVCGLSDCEKSHWGYGF